jgi:beta-glucosidase/6-phospho-beta-glucosidase/beta-galactosidase
MQVTVMRAGVEAVYRARSEYNVTGYRWFDLRDADSSSSSFESQYGLMYDDYSPKPAFAVYRQLIAEFDAP